MPTSPPSCSRTVPPDNTKPSALEDFVPIPLDENWLEVARSKGKKSSPVRKPSLVTRAVKPATTMKNFDLKRTLLAGTISDKCKETFETDAERQARETSLVVHAGPETKRPAALSPLEKKKKRFSPGQKTPSRTTSVPMINPTLKPCCSCKKNSKCATQRCECIKANRACLCCESQGTKCSNKEALSARRKQLSSLSSPDADPTTASKKRAPPEQALPEQDDNEDASKNEPVMESIRVQHRQSSPTPEEDGDLPNCAMTETDRKLIEVHGDHMHKNPGAHLNGKIKDDPL